MAIIGIVIGVCMFCFLVVVILFLIAPRGYEDDRGFHFESEAFKSEAFKSEVFEGEVEKRQQRVPRYPNSRIKHPQQPFITKNPAA